MQRLYAAIAAFSVLVLAACSSGTPKIRVDESALPIGAPRAQIDSTESFVFFLPAREEAEGAETFLVERKAVLPGAFSIGKKDAPVTVIEFADFECPYCASSHVGVREIANKLIQQGTVRWIFADYPLEQIHPGAMDAALAARCSGEIAGPGGFWVAHTTLFERQMGWSKSAEPGAAIRRIVSSLGVPTEKLNRCMADEKKKDPVRRMYQLGIELGVGGTPTYFINGLPWVGVLDPNRLNSMTETFSNRSVRDLLREDGVRVESAEIP